MDDDVIVFKASLPAIKSALLISGDGNGGSIKLDVPELEIDVFRRLLEMRRDTLIVTIQRERAAEPVAQPARVVAEGAMIPPRLHGAG